MQKVSCSQCGQTYMGGGLAGDPPWDCELCGGTGCVSAAPDDEPAGAGASAGTGAPAGGGKVFLIPAGVLIVVLGGVIWMVSGKGGQEAAKRTSRPIAASAPAVSGDKGNGGPSETAMPVGETPLPAGPHSSIAKAGPAMPGDAAETSLFHVPAEIPGTWQDIIAKIKGQIPPFDERGRPGVPQEGAEGFFRMVQGFTKLSEDERTSYLQWLATTHESSDLRIWACSMLADTGHKPELRAVQQAQKDERVKRYIEWALNRPQRKSKLNKKQGK